eukprot:scaffold3096_cov403-Prasinococcus_capsulatus_cf.AAC.11
MPATRCKLSGSLSYTPSHRLPVYSERLGNQFWDSAIALYKVDGLFCHEIVDGVSLALQQSHKLEGRSDVTGSVTQVEEYCCQRSGQRLHRSLYGAKGRLPPAAREGPHGHPRSVASLTGWGRAQASCGQLQRP